MPRLIEIDWPDNGAPALPPPLSLRDCEARLAAVREGMAARGLSALVVYGDREHMANLHWVTGFDPRFEEALLVVTAGAAHLLAGNECLPYTALSPLVEAGRIEVHLVPSLSLLSQPREGLRLDAAVRRLVPEGGTVGAAGWKYWEAGEVADPETALDIPALLADLLRERCRVVNAGEMFMHPGHGLRSTVDAAEVARLEFAHGAASRAVRAVLFGLREGMTDFEALAAARLGALPLACHPTFATGARAAQGLTSPSGETIRRGAPLSFNIAPQGANVCRAGWVAESAADLPEAARDTIEAFVGPYLEAMSEWCGLMRPGVRGGQVWEHMMNRLPPDLYGVTLNPGHLIGMDEWISSPIFRDSDLPLRSGMAMQMDVIPGHPVHASTRLEDGYVLADEELRGEIQARFPEVARRCAARVAFMRETLGLELPDTLLPLGDTCGVLAPFFLSPRKVLTLR